MAQVINTNSLSLMAQNNLNKSQSALGTAIERLSSGLRINSAKDDAAGQAISNRFTANINGLTQASRNANDGISLAQTTEGALNEVNDNLQNIRRLAVQAQNGSNSASDLSSIQDEINQRLDEIDRISKQTDFNGVKVLSGDQKLSIQVGSQDGQTIDIDLKAINRSTLGLDGFSVAKNSVSVGDAITTVTGDGTGAPVPVDLGAAAKDLGADASTLSLHALKDKDGKLTGNYVVQSGDNFYAASLDTTTGKVGLNKTDVKYTDSANGLTTAATQAQQLVKVGVDKNGNNVGYVTFQGKSYAAAGTLDNGKDKVTGNTAMKGTAVDTVLELSGAAATATFSGVSSADPLSKLDSALSQVDGLRSGLGAVQNRFDSVINNLNSTVNNLSASRSRIQDADYATEVSNMSRAQILQQAGTSVLAQANQSTQNVLSLLR
ncbi:flagellin [Edwardsiella tarda]|uniref:flagellin N-terminal helical domain-containing protein n=1 Tax=Edwardsiella tarda TaxID=636 RepID=UPI00351C8D30